MMVSGIDLTSRKVIPLRLRIQSRPQMVVEADRLAVDNLNLQILQTEA